MFRECDHSLSDVVDESPQAYGWSDGCLQIATGVVCTEVNLTSSISDKKGWIYTYGLMHESGVAKLTCHEGNIEEVQENNLQEGPNGVGTCDTSGGQLRFECTYKATRPYNGAKLVAWAGEKYWHAVRTDARASTIFDVGYYTDRTEKMKEAHKSVIWGKNTANGRRYSVRHLTDEDLSTLWHFEAVDADLEYTGDASTGLRLNDIKSEGVAYCKVEADYKSSGELFQKKCVWKETVASDNGTHLVLTAAESCNGNAVSASCVTKPRWFSLKENERVEIEYHCLAGSGRIFLGGMEIGIGNGSSWVAAIKDEMTKKWKAGQAAVTIGTGSIGFSLNTIKEWLLKAASAGMGKFFLVGAAAIVAGPSGAMVATVGLLANRF